MNCLGSPSPTGQRLASKIPLKTDSPEARTLIDDLLAEQRQLTVVEQFARSHERHEIATPRYRNLIPLSMPSSGQQFAFEVDLDKCSGCKACVTACHSLNGLDHGEVWRDVGQLVSDDWRRPFQQTITTACHHCADPGCLNGCPVLAYEKDSVTGIVRHLDDQCIGCQYCVLKCPYDVPKYSQPRGIVRKCDMCSQRLAISEAPACVQACPNEAIRITLIEVETIAAQFRQGSSRREEALTEPSKFRIQNSEVDQSLPALAAESRWLPGSPEPAITLPTTRFVSKKPLASDLVPADAAEVKLQPAHWPLVWMLTLTQLSVGAMALLASVPQLAQPLLALLALASGTLGLAVSVLHLGKPLKAWRSFLGLRKSWLSREIVMLGLFLPLAVLTAATRWPWPGAIPGFVDATAFLSWATPLLGLLGVFCSGMVYHDTQRVFWLGARSVGKFLGTTAVLGLAASWLISETQGDSRPWLAAALAAASAVKLAGEHRMLRRAGQEIAQQAWPKPGNYAAWSLARSALLMRDRLGLVTRTRFFAGLAGGVLLPLASLLPATTGAGALAAAAFALCWFGELAERYLFFRAVVPPKMPGAV